VDSLTFTHCKRASGHDRVRSLNNILEQGYSQMHRAEAEDQKEARIVDLSESGAPDRLDRTHASIPLHT